MKEVSLSDVSVVAARLEKISPYVCGSTDPGWAHPTAVRIIDCVLALNRRYDGFVVPRLDAFMARHPEVRRVAELANLMAIYTTPFEFMAKELQYNHADRARILHSVVRFVCTIVEKTPMADEEEILKHWAIQAKPHEFKSLNIKGFKLAGFQYLRMLFGAQTTKPSTHIRGYLFELLNRDVSDLESLALLEAAAEHAGLSVRDVDNYIWRIRARDNETELSKRAKGEKFTNIVDLTAPNDELRTEYDETSLKDGIRGKYAQEHAASTNIVRLAPDVAAAFPNDEAVNEALRFVLKIMDDTRNLTRYSDWK